MSTFHPHNIRFCWPRDLDAHASVRGHDSGSSVGLKAKLPLGHFVFLMPLNQQINKAATLWDGETAPDDKGKVELRIDCDELLRHSPQPRILLRAAPGASMSNSKIQWKLHQPN